LFSAPIKPTYVWNYRLNWRWLQWSTPFCFSGHSFGIHKWLSHPYWCQL